MTQSTPLSDNASNASPSLSLEGRLIAHRLLLTKLLRLTHLDSRANLLTWLGDRAVYQDGQEDPGAVSGVGLELELARADEFRLLKLLFDSADR